MSGGANVEKFKREYQARWDARHLRTFSTKLTKKQAQRPRDTCSRADTNPYRLLQNMLLTWIREQEVQQARQEHQQRVRFIDI